MGFRGFCGLWNRAEGVVGLFQKVGLDSHGFSSRVGFRVLRGPGNEDPIVVGLCYRLSGFPLCEDGQEPHTKGWLRVE